MQLVTYLPVIAEPRAFIDFWAARYTDIDDDFYATNIGEELTEVRVLAWFEWKNGMPLSPRKRQSVLQNYVARLGDLDQISEDEAAADTLARFGGGIIWRIFWLHCWRPSRFPIYDRYVHRAMRFVDAGVIEEIPQQGADKLRAYAQSYIPFHAQFSFAATRTVDKALWAYGKFLGDNNFPTIPL